MFQKKAFGGITAVSLITAAAAVFPYSAAHAQEATSTTQDLEQRLRVIERQLEIQKEEAEAKAKDGSTVVANDKGFSIKSNKGDYELKFRALVQLDGRFYAGDNRAPGTVAQNPNSRFSDGFELRRVRPTFDGTLGKWVTFRITPELAGASATVLDAYFDVALQPWAKLRAGRFKTPVGLERYFYSTNALNHVEFGLPTALVPNRDFGLQLHGDLLSNTLNYAVAFTNGATDGQDSTPTRDNDNRKEVAVRLFAEPFKNNPGFLQGLGFGVGASHGSKLGSTSNTLVTTGYRTPGQNNFFVYDGQTANNATTVFANGEQQRISPQGYFHNNSFGTLAEYVISSQKVRNGAGTGEITNRAWQISTTYVLTGEDASTRGVKIASPYAPGGDGWGAFEVAARVGQLDIDSEAFQRGFATPDLAAQKQATTWGVGLNWYINNNVKAVVNYDETSFDAYNNGATRPIEKAIFTRLQLSY